MKLLLFDFDGTLTTRDSLPAMLVFAVGWPCFLIKMPIVAARFFSLLVQNKWSGNVGKEVLLSLFLKNRTRDDLEKLGRDFCKKKLPAMLRTELLAEAKQARAAGDRVAVVSASCDFWLLPFCEKHGFELVCTELEYVGGRFSGRFLTKNCNFGEKAERIRARFDLSEFDEILAWGNSTGDSAMLELADRGTIIG